MSFTNESLLKHPIFSQFREICNIPHGSGNEQGLSNHLLAWAKARGLDAVQDERFNLFIKKPATSGYDQLPTVMLQAHLDMVCEKAEGVEHDFSTDPIQWVVDGDLLSTGGRTTLGADNGIGVALALSLLEDDNLEHPSLEVLLTTSEEEDMAGAEHFDITKSKAQYLINLDHANDNEILCGSCGGRQVDLDIPLQMQEVPSDWQAYELSVHGMHGGHSGEDIHRGHGNANILLARLFMELDKICSFKLHEIQGGTFRLAIPRQARSVLLMQPSDFDKARQAVEALAKDMRAELSETGIDLTVVFQPAQAEPVGTDCKPVIDAMTLIPDGIFQMNESLPGLVDASDNLGEITLDEHGLHFVLEIRSARESLGVYLFQRMERLALLLGGTCHYSNPYPSWNFRSDSPLREKCVRVYETCFHKKPVLITVHAGLEVGYLTQHNESLDAVAIGPSAWDFHSPSERVSITSTLNVYDFLCSLLSNRTL